MSCTKQRPQLRFLCVADGMRYVTPKTVQRVLDDLLTSEQAAEFLGLKNGANALLAYASHFADFPRPVLVGDSGRCPRWLRAHLVQWRKAHPPRSRAGDADPS